MGEAAGNHRCHQIIEAGGGGKLHRLRLLRLRGQGQRQPVAAGRLGLELEREPAGLGERARAGHEIGGSAGLQFKLNLGQWQALLAGGDVAFIECELDVGESVAEHRGAALETRLEHRRQWPVAHRCPKPVAQLRHEEFDVGQALG